MRIGLLSDIHGNREALDACLASVAEARCDRLVLLGDLVGYGPDPAYIVDRARELAAEGAIVIRGNHDDYVARPRWGMSEPARIALDWTRGRLDAETRTYLGDLPLAVREDDRLYVHASADEPAEWTYVMDADTADLSLRATDARLVFCGHTHVPALFRAAPGRRPQSIRPVPDGPIALGTDHRHLLVLGAVGQPRDRNPAACWGLIDTEAQHARLVRVSYDVANTTRKIRQAGLPEWLARRLGEGR